MMSNQAKWFCMVCVLLLSSCVAHWNQSQCQTANLYEQGLIDGRKGDALSQIARYQSDCARFSIHLNEADYQKGWRAGNHQYCQPGTLYGIAKAGGGYPAVCAQSHAQVQAYERGHGIYLQIQTLGQQISAIDEQLNQSESLQMQYQQLLDRMTAVRDRVVQYHHPENDDERKQWVRARAELAALRDQRRSLELQLSASRVSDAVNRPRLLQQRFKLQQALNRLQQK